VCQARRRAQVPVAVYQGGEDMDLAPAATEANVKTACAAGTAVSFTRYQGIDHVRLPAGAKSGFLTWIGDRFAGKPAPATCG
jgi:Secretory lipase